MSSARLPSYCTNTSIGLERQVGQVLWLLDIRFEPHHRLPILSLLQPETQAKCNHEFNKAGEDGSFSRLDDVGIDLRQSLVLRPY